MIRYEISMPHPHSHLYEVRMTIEDAPPDLHVVLPAWTPGSYKIRDYARHVQDVRADTGAVDKVDKNTWRVSSQPGARVVLSYRVYADELTVRTSHLDSDHGFFNPSNVFFFVRGQLDRASHIKVVPPPGWKVTTALQALPGEENLFACPDYDTLVDSPFECGTHQVHAFQVNDTPHALAVFGRGNYDADLLVSDLETICKTASGLFRELPCPRYVFICHLPSNGRGGLEHKDSTVVMAPRFGFRPRDKYEDFLALCAHEYFHLWNGKRMHPVGLGPFDYEREVHTRCLWVVEGFTSYYNDLLLARGGLIDARTFLKRAGKTWNGLLDTPGRRFQSLSESSFDTWIKYYQRSAHSTNSTVSYYEKGSLVAMLLDLEIRRTTQGQRSLDDVLRALWREYGRSEVSYPDDAVRRLAEEMAGQDMGGFFAAYVDGTEEMPLPEVLSHFGVRTVSEGDEESPPWLGVRTRYEHGRLQVTEVVWDSPAFRDGLSAGDELLAIDGHRLTDAALRPRLAECKLGDTVTFTVFRDDVLRTVPVKLTERARQQVRFEPDPDASADALELFAGWMGEKVATRR